MTGIYKTLGLCLIAAILLSKPSPSYSGPFRSPLLIEDLFEGEDEAQALDAFFRELFEQAVNPAIPAANQSSPLTRLPKEVFWTLAAKLNPQEYAALSAVNKRVHTYLNLPEWIERQAEARAEIERLIGRLIRLKPGSFVLPTHVKLNYVDRSSGETHEYSCRHKKLKYVEITESYFMPEFDLTQEQYDHLMGAGSAAASNPFFSGSKKPMRGLSQDEWNAYLASLNMALARLWPIAYPLTRTPIARRPTMPEFIYANTEPSVLSWSLTSDGIKKTTARLKKYSTTSSLVRAKWLFFRRFNSLKDVDFGESNARGFKNLVGNAAKQVEHFYGGNEPPTIRMIGCSWENCKPRLLGIRCGNSADVRLPVWPAVSAGSSTNFDSSELAMRIVLQ